MGQRGPQRKPGSRRWNAEYKKRVLANGNIGKPGKVDEPAPLAPSDLPKCPPLSRKLAARWQELMLDMIAAGVTVQQIDSRAIALAARYEDSLERYDELCEREGIEPEIYISALRSRQFAMREYLAALEKIGGTPLVRMRARIAPEDKKPKDDDPWSGV